MGHNLGFHSNFALFLSACPPIDTMVMPVSAPSKSRRNSQEKYFTQWSKAPTIKIYFISRQFNHDVREEVNVDVKCNSPCRSEQIDHQLITQSVRHLKMEGYFATKAHILIDAIRLQFPAVHTIDGKVLCAFFSSNL